MKNQTIVVITNGYPGAGKDLLIKNCMDYANGEDPRFCNCEYGVSQLSTIDPMKKILKDMGWNGTKDNASRYILAELKQMWIRVSDGPTCYAMNEILKIHNKEKRSVVFVQIREPEEIQKLVSALNGLHVIGIQCMTLFVSRKESMDKITKSNQHMVSDADKFVCEFKYDMSIENNKSKEQYQKDCIELFNKHILNKLKLEELQ